jgi:hypothetical protein
MLIADRQMTIARPFFPIYFRDDRHFTKIYDVDRQS